MIILLSTDTEDEGDVPMASLSKGEYPHPTLSNAQSEAGLLFKNISISLTVRNERIPLALSFVKG